MINQSQSVRTIGFNTKSDVTTDRVYKTRCSVRTVRLRRIPYIYVSFTYTRAAAAERRTKTSSNRLGHYIVSPLLFFVKKVFFYTTSARPSEIIVQDLIIISTLYGPLIPVRGASAAALPGIRLALRGNFVRLDDRIACVYLCIFIYIPTLGNMCVYTRRYTPYTTYATRYILLLLLSSDTCKKKKKTVRFEYCIACVREGERMIKIS